MFAGAHHASMKMLREEGPKASIEIRRKALGPQSGSQKAIFEAELHVRERTPRTARVQRAEQSGQDAGYRNAFGPQSGSHRIARSRFYPTLSR